MTQLVKDFDLLDAHIRVFNWRNIRRVDWLLAVVVLALAFAGFAVLYSASRSTHSAYYLRQVLFFAFGVVMALAILCTDSRFLVSLAPAMYVVAVTLLLAVILFGAEVKGGQRWLPMGPIKLQPSEQSKVVIVYMLTWYLTLVKDRIQKLPYFLLAFVLVGVPAVLILKQPSLGTAIVLFPTAAVMVYAAGCKPWHLATLAVLAAAMVYLAWPPNGPIFKRLEEHQQKRIRSFLNPEADPKDGGWQTRQSKITIGSGGLSGKGYLQGTQTMLKYLPEHHTDFIFAVLAEEQGFIGGVVVIGLFAVFLLRGLQFARDCPDMSGTLLAVGTVTILGFHIFINIAITIGLMPVTGIPLPFLSYGGNFYLTTMMGVGILLNVPVRKHLFE